MLAIYFFLLVFLLVLFILFTAIVLTFKLKVLSVEEKKELGGMFTVKWLFFSHTFLIGEPKEKKGPEQTESREEDIIKAEPKMQAEKRREPGEKKPEEETVILEGKEKITTKEKVEGKEKSGTKEKAEIKEKRGIFARIKRKKRVSTEEEPETKEGMTAREKLHWGLEAYKALRKPLFRLFSDMFNAIKIKNLKADLTFGLSDPAETGMLCGVIHSLLGTVYSRCRSCSFSVCPVFMESRLDFRGSAEIRIKIYSLIFPFLKFIFNGKTLSFTYSIVKEKLRGSSKVNS
ncbi:MAG: DUF2953 domain-containing protein [Methanosarcina sp.]|nr:DUF2953 domain-containing protein [Methanosarcina sp.]